MIRIDLETLTTGGLKLLLDSAQGEHLLALGRAEGVRGACEIGAGRVVLRDLGAEAVGLERSTLKLPGGTGELELSSPGALHRLALEGVLEVDHDLRFAGTGSIGTVALDGVRLSWGELRSECRVAAGQIRYWENGGERELDVATLTILGLNVALGWVELRVERLEVRGVRTRLAPGGVFHLECAKVMLKGMSVRTSGVHAEIESIELGAGLSAGPTGVLVREFSVDSVRVEVPSISALTKPSNPAVPAGGRLVPDLPFLDLVDGHVHLDVSLEVAVPLVKKRAAKYSTRLDVERGIVDYHAIERGLAWLEDALIDFELEGDRLILELDPIPLVKFDNKTLVWWKLAGHDLELARRKRVRLRKLLEYRLDDTVAARANHGAGSESPLLLKLTIDDLDIALSVGGPSELSAPGVRLRLGAEGVPALESLRLAGAIHYAAGAELPPTELSMALRGLVVKALRLALPFGAVTVGAVDVRAVEPLVVTFCGAVPGRVGLAIDHLRLVDIEATLPGAAQA